MQTSQENTGQEEKTNGNLIVLPVGEGGENPRFVHTVRQQDLIELQYLSRLFSEARENWEEKKEWIKAALRGGAGVEPGLLTAELALRKREPHQVDACEFYELVVR